MLLVLLVLVQVRILVQVVVQIWAVVLRVASETRASEASEWSSGIRVSTYSTENKPRKLGVLRESNTGAKFRFITLQSLVETQFEL